MAEKKRDYAAERQRTKQNKAKAQAPVKEQPAKVTPAKKAAPVNKADRKHAVEQITDPPEPVDCGSIPIPLSSIISDPNQPRKYFDMVKLMELSRSIIKHQVIQAIIVRPIAGGLFMVVCGERRFRGSLIANEAGHDVTTIPCQIRELTDEQALEIQLIENLQRTDPHPIEDAHTFQRMIDGGHNVEEIANRIDKSTKFVAMRLMLNNLTEPFKEVFFANKMSLGQAVMLCKLSPESQAAIFQDEVADNWKEDKDFHLDDIDHLVNRESENLDKALFKTEDATLYPEMGACGPCKFNSGNTLSLFADEDSKSRICGNGICFQIKTSRAYKQSIEAVMTDPTIAFVAGHHYTDSDKQKVKDVEKLEVPVLQPGTWNRVIVNEEPTWEAYLADNEGNFDPENDNREEFEKETRKEFDEAFAEWKEESEKIAAARAEGKIHKAFIVVGNDAGTVVEVIASTPQAELKLTGSAAGAGDMELNLKIEEINKREERKKEIDAEKIWVEVRSQMLVGDHFTKDIMLSFVEQSALAVALFESLEWNTKKVFAKGVMKIEDVDDPIQVTTAFQKITSQQQCILYRTIIGSKLFPLTGSHLKNYVNAAGFSVAKSLIPDTVKNVESIQYAKADKRAKDVKKAIEKLQGENEPEEKDEDKKPAETPPAE